MPGPNSVPRKDATFIEPMECLAVSKLPDGPQWVYEIKLDGYRAIAVKAGGKLNLFSRRGKSFNRQYRGVFDSLADLPDNTVIDGEVVAINDAGLPDFNLLQHYRSEAQRIFYFVFDLLVCRGQSLMAVPLIERRGILATLKFESPKIVTAKHFEASAATMLESARAQKLEGVIAKRRDSRYEPGKRTGAWVKHRLNSGQELVIGGYVPGAHGVDAVVVGYYCGSELMYVARVKNGFVPATRGQVFEKLRSLVVPGCPFVNLPEKHKGRWGDGLTADDMKKCVWVQPEIVAQVEFSEWTESDHLRHSKFAGLRQDKNPRTVVKEHAGEG